MDDYLRPMMSRPPFIDSGDIAFVVPRKLSPTAERMLGIHLVRDRQLFGLCYRELMPEFFDSMPRKSGVMVRLEATSHKVLPGLCFPGDIDVLVIPYIAESLVLSKTLAIELKAVPASYAKQGKSPNKYGFKQANALLRAGFPLVAVGHLVVSDQSPREAWRSMAMTRILDNSGRCEPLQTVDVDMLPMDLVNRSHGRLIANRSDIAIGVFAAYIGGKGRWYPSGAPTTTNAAMSQRAMDAVYAYYHQNWRSFLDTPRWPPDFSLKC